MKTAKDNKDKVIEILRRIEERQIAQAEYRMLGHRIVWNENGECNVPGMPRLRGEELNEQLERQKKYY